MEWMDLGLGVLAAVGIVLLPGILVSVVLGFRGLAAWALAVPAGVTVIVLGALISPLIGLAWGPLPVAIAAAAVLAASAVLRLTLWRTPSARPPHAPLPFAGRLAIGGSVVVILAQLLVVIGDPSNFSQTFDNIFHLNAMRYALDTRSVSPLTIGSMTSAPTGGLPFYPTAWHAVGTLVIQLTGVSIPVASNAVMILFAAFAWPLSIALFTRVLFGASAPVLVAAAAVSASIPAFPLLLVEYGVLFPYMMSLSMIAVPLAFVVESCRGSQRWPLIVAALGTVPAIAVAHPGGVAALIAFVSAVLAVFWILFLRSAHSARRKAAVSALVVVYAGVALAAWYVLRPPAAARTWTPTETAGQAIGEVLTASVWFSPVNIAVATLTVAGVVVAVRRRSAADWVAVAMLATAGGLYLVVSGLAYPLIRDMLTGPWYNNAPRLAALLAFAWVPLSAAGGAHLWGVLREWCRRIERRDLRRAVAVAIAVIILLALPQVGAMRHAVQGARAAFAVTDRSPLVTSDELALIERLDDEVPEDAVILGSPWTGTALAYALADRRVVMPHTLMDITDDMSEVLNRLDTARAGSKVCDALERLGVEYVLDFGTQEVNDGEHEYKGLDRLESSSAVEEVDAVGDAVLYEVVVCG